METKIVDTMRLIKLCKNKDYQQVGFCEMSLYEIMKNKTNSQRQIQFYNINQYVKNSMSVCYVSDLSINIFDNRNLDERLLDAIKICEKCAYVIARTSLFFCVIIVELLFIEKSKKVLNEENKNFFERICATLKKTYDLICNENKDELIDIFFNNSKEAIDLFLIKISNIFINKINEFSPNELFNLKEINSFRTNDVSVINKIKFKQESIDWFVDNIIEFQQNELMSKKFYKAYLNDLLLVSGKFESNDVVDMNIAFSAIYNNLSIDTEENRIKKIVDIIKN